MKLINYEDLTPELARQGCFVTGMPNAAYHSYEGISKTGLDLVHRSPAHYRYGAKREATRAMHMGTAIHTALLEPDRFEMEYLLLRDVKDRRASEYKQAIKVHDPENVLVSTEADKVAGMQESVFAQEDAANLLRSGGFFEVSAFVEDPDTGILLRCRYDVINAFHEATDLKKTRNASPEEFAKSVYNYRYHVQDAMYSDIYRLITGNDLDAFKFVAVEEDAPHCAMVYELDEESRQIGYQEYRRDLELYAECEMSGNWPGYPEPVQTISLPAWAINRFEDDLEVEL